MNPPDRAAQTKRELREVAFREDLADMMKNAEIVRGTRLRVVDPLGSGDAWFDQEFIATGPPEGGIVWFTYAWVFDTEKEINALLERPAKYVEVLR